MPLQTIELIESETAPLLANFFKAGQDNVMNFDLLLQMLDQKEILPLLASYFFRANLCLFNNKCKETIEHVYQSPAVFQKLIQHSSHSAISNTLQLYLSLDMNKNLPKCPERLATKVGVVKSILQRITEEGSTQGVNSVLAIENLSAVLIEVVDKYFLIVDGKAMMEVLCSQESVQAMLDLIKVESESSFPAFHFFISLINYYSYSSFSDDPKTSPETLKKNAEKL